MNSHFNYGFNNNPLNITSITKYIENNFEIIEIFYYVLSNTVEVNCSSSFENIRITFSTGTFTLYPHFAKYTMNP